MIPRKYSYRSFAEFYDCLDTHDAQFFSFLKRKIAKYAPHTRSVLEMACGMGRVISRFPKYYQRSGFDLSWEMVAVAKKKHPGIHFYVSDMRTFSLEKSVDVVFCVYDSINHLLCLNDWKQAFARAYRALKPRGLFIFDMNTPAKLNSFRKVPVQIYKHRGGICSIRIHSTGNSTAVWNITIIKKNKEKTSCIQRETIREKAFPISAIKHALAPYFIIHEAIDDKNNPVTKKTKRVFFVCRKK